MSILIPEPVFVVSLIPDSMKNTTDPYLTPSGSRSRSCDPWYLHFLGLWSLITYTSLPPCHVASDRFSVKEGFSFDPAICISWDDHFLVSKFVFCKNTSGHKWLTKRLDYSLHFTVSLHSKSNLRLLSRELIVLRPSDFALEINKSN